MLTCVRSARRLLIDDVIVGCRRIQSIVHDPEIPPLKYENEPVLSYIAGSDERKELKMALDEMQLKVLDVPIVIGEEEYYTGEKRVQVQPHDHKKVLANYFHATPLMIQQAIKTAVKAQKEWDRIPLTEKVAIWEKAADLMANDFRFLLNAATMLGQSKTVIQAEIDSAAELVDFFRFNANYAWEIMKYKPISVQPHITKNSLRYRGLEGFIGAISPFNFTAIGGNLAFTPALMGNAVVWKPSDTAILSNYLIFKILKEAGLPPGIVNFVPADGPTFGNVITTSHDLAAINFTGSVGTFNWLWQRVGENIDLYKSYPRMIGECGGKNYHLIHQSADIKVAAIQTIRSAFEYCGQKCSACSRLYVAESIWPQFKSLLLSLRAALKYGDPTDFQNFMGAVIDHAAYSRITNAIHRCHDAHRNVEILGGGGYNREVGYFIEPTIVQVQDPTDPIMRTELFGPVLAVYVYDDHQVDLLMDMIQSSTRYALTGAIFAMDVNFLKKAEKILRMSAGNFYINDKSTGAVVGQQPFGGARKSGTNDKAGGPHYVLRFTSPQSVKETMDSSGVEDVEYPFMIG